jgi:hypothetical protein
MGRRKGFWGWYWRALAAYRGYKIITHEVEAAKRRGVAREAAAEAAERAIAAGVGREEAERIAERAARAAVRERGEMATIARKAVAAAPDTAMERAERMARTARMMVANGYTPERAAELAAAMM